MSPARAARWIVRARRAALATSIVLLVAAPSAQAQSMSATRTMFHVAGGAYRPFFKSSGRGMTVPVAAFWVDRAPVTNVEFARFLRRAPEWTRSRVPELFAERGYLAEWRPGHRALPAGDAPVTYVSWFAARAYCSCQGKRLPTQAEWEWAFGGHHAVAGAVASAAVNRASALRFAMGTPPGSGCRVGEVWEWTDDFDSPIVVDPEQRVPEASAFCGDGYRAVDAHDYAGFLRFSFRSSLRARYTLKDLGFRCVRSVDAGTR